MLQEEELLSEDEQIIEAELPVVKPVLDPKKSEVLVKAIKEKILEIFDKINSGELKPKDSGLPLLFNELMNADLVWDKYKQHNKQEGQDEFLRGKSAYFDLIDQYQTITRDYFAKNPKELKKNPKELQDRIIKKQVEALMSSKQMEDLINSDDFDPEFINSKRGSIARAIKNVNKDKVAKVKELKPKRDPNTPRDRSPFVFMGESFGKGQLVMAVIKQYVVKNPSVTHDQLKSVFPDHLLRGYGIFKKLAEAKSISKTRQRYFLKDAQVVKLKCGTVVAVSNQFTGDNIVSFLNVANKLGFEIKK